MEVTQFLFICGIFSTIGSPIYASCPENPTTAIQACSNDLGFDPSSGDSHNLVGNITKARQMCKSKMLTKSIDCMKEIMDDCSDSQQNMKQLNQLINIQGWKDAMETLCDNLDYLEQNKDCMRKGTADMEICIEKENRLFQAEMQIKMQKMMAEGQPDQSKIRKMTCGLISKMLNCITGSPMKLCPKKIMNIIKTVFYGFVPPMCDNEIPKQQQGKYIVDDSDDDHNGTGSGSIVLGSAVIVFLTAVSSGFLAL